MTIKRCFAAAGLAVALGAVQCVSAFADDSMNGSGMAMDCSTANDHLMKMAGAPSADTSMMKPSASVDMNFMVSMHSMMQNQMAMAKIEVKCGTNAKAKAEAQKMLDSLRSYTTEAMDIQHQIP